MPCTFFFFRRWGIFQHKTNKQLVKFEFFFLKNLLSDKKTNPINFFPDPLAIMSKKRKFTDSIQLNKNSNGFNQQRGMPHPNSSFSTTYSMDRMHSLRDNRIVSWSDFAEAYVNKITSDEGCRDANLVLKQGKKQQAITTANKD